MSTLPELTSVQLIKAILKGYEIKVDGDGNREWYKNGKRHREDGPAYEWADGSKQWYLNDKYHREDGPAYEGANGTRYWYLNGKEMSEEEFNQIMKSKNV